MINEQTFLELKNHLALVLAAIETPGDLSEQEIQHVFDDASKFLSGLEDQS